MSLGQRLFQVARAEIKSAFRRLRQIQTSDLGIEPNEGEKNVEQDTHNRQSTSQSTLPEEPPVSVCRAYTNLELPMGASVDEVRAAYRRLMRRYHPDQHHEDESKTDAANELSRKLKAAHDELIEYLKF